MSLRKTNRILPLPLSTLPSAEQWKLPGYHTLHRQFTPQIVPALEMAWNHPSTVNLIQLNVQSRSHSSLTVFVQPTDTHCFDADNNKNTELAELGQNKDRKVIKNEEGLCQELHRLLGVKAVSPFLPLK
ncbi:unnamed protein product [Nezara viridula]|uniref:Uncharacterized protein n=1 Tax=Nezara viridula TaxID=85310 RepID=A0A9P0E8Z5_NEZVI|nr:unnamed protein product [Nezara viridula]